MVSKEQIIEKVMQKYKKSLEDLSSVYIFGAKSLGIITYNGLKSLNIHVEAFLDNNSSLYGKNIDQISTYPLTSIRKTKPVIIIASILYMNEMIDQIEMTYPNAVIIPYPILSIWNEKKFPQCFTLDNLFDDVVYNFEEYKALSIKLADERSRQILSNIINFRFTLNFRWMKVCKDCVFQQYFDLDVISKKTNEVFVDGGGYDGDTTLQYIRTLGKYKKIYFYEPDFNLLLKAKNFLKNNDNICFRQCGLYNQNEKLLFGSTGDVNGKIQADGKKIIDVVSLDNDILEKITFIKLDIEGSEQKALLGAKNHIQNDHPKMAIAVYHQADDIWKIPQIIHSLDSSYKFYLRHYTYNVADTVLYCI
jgi:FkbM family methyltransferase